MKKTVSIPIALTIVVVAFVLGRMTGDRDGHSSQQPPSTTMATSAQLWTCSMHPHIKQPRSGKCPICAMDLVSVAQNTDSNLGPTQIELSSSAIQRAQIQTAPVRREMPVVEVRMVGKIDYDETRLSYITARFPGRLDRLFVDYTGLRVNPGDHLAEIYSPELLAAQEELLQAIRTSRELAGSSSTLLRERAMETVKAAREKLLLWDLTAEQVAVIEERGVPSDRLTIFAPSRGVVIRKEAVEGKYVETGAPIYTISDLSQVWVKLDAYETDLVWLHFGQDVRFTTEAYPGEVFTGRIAFIDPVLNPTTRTARIRVNMENPEGKLKPGMFVNATVRSQVVADGKVMSPELAGKWISPMHPEIVSDKPGPCPVCGMDLVSAESLGYLPADVDESTLPLVIPSTAPLITGKRALVYVAVKDRPGVFEGRVVELGPRAGGQYIVSSGLREGELVVVNGAFKIDSAVQILAQPSMMNPVEEPGAAGDQERHRSFIVPSEFQTQLGKAIDAYVPVSTALSLDRLADAQTALEALELALEAVDTELLVGDAQVAALKHLAEVRNGVNEIKGADDLEAARTHFEHVAGGFIRAAESLGIESGSAFYVYHCPMAFNNRGADWIQSKKGTENPFFGSRMYTCGSEKRELKWRGSSTQRPPLTGHEGHQH